MSYPEFTAQMRKGVYRRVICGVRKARLQGKRVMMLNLTTASANVIGLSDDEKMEAVAKAWNELHWILTKKYGNFEHYGLITNEGNGVMHVPIAGLPFVYYKRMMKWWHHVYGSYVWMSAPRGSAEGIAGYLMSQYLSHQSATKAYGRMSDNWICPRFMTYWRMLRNCSRDWSKGQMTDFGYWHYPMVKEWLVKNFLRWLKLYLKDGVLREYVGLDRRPYDQAILPVPWY